MSSDDPCPRARPVLRPVAPCAEMPNDNPALHLGAIWGCDAVVGPPTAHVEASAHVQGVPDLDRVDGRVEGHVDAVRQVERPDPFTATSGVLPDLDDLVPPPRHSEIRRLSPSGELGESLLDASPPPPATLGDARSVEVPRPEDARGTAGAGAGDVPDGGASRPGAGEALRTILEAVVTARGGEPARLRLAALLDEAPPPAGAPARTPAADRLARAYRGWGRTLAGEDVDFAETGGTMLDEWAALACAAALGDGAPVTELRRELRGRGVAAFGLVDAA